MTLSKAIFSCMLPLAFSGVAAHAFTSDDFPVSSSSVGDPDRFGYAKDVKISVTLDLTSNITVERPRIYFHDFSECVGAKKICDELYNIDFSISPSPGGRLNISSNQILEVLAKEFDGVDFKLTGARLVKVKAAYQIIEKDTIQKYLADIVTSSLNSQSNLRLKSLKVQSNRGFKVWPGEYRLLVPDIDKFQNFHIDWILSHFLGSRSWAITYLPFNQDGFEKQEFIVRVNVEIERQNVVSKIYLDKGLVLKHEHLEYRWQKLGKNNQEDFTEIKHLVGLKTKKIIYPGLSLSPKAVETEKLVKRGQQVRMVFRRGKMSIKTSAKALGSAGEGQTVRVFYPATKKFLRGRVIGPSLVEVMM